MEDPHGKELTIALVDQAFRSHRPARIADQLALPARALRRAAVHGVVGAGGAHAGRGDGALPARAGRAADRGPPAPRDASRVILPGEEQDLRRYLDERRTRRHAPEPQPARRGDPRRGRGARGASTSYLALLARDDVEYISVKVSSVFSQINLVAFRDTVERVKERLRPLYRQALAPPLPPPRRSPHAEVHQPRHGGVPRPRPDRRGLPRGARRAGVPGAAAPGSCCRPTCPMRTACSGSSRAGRSSAAARGGAPIKVRIVKGANLAMERVEAALQRLAPGALRQQAGGRRQLQADGRVRLPARARPRGAPRRRQPQPLRPGLRPAAARRAGRPGPGSSSRCSRAWPTTRPGRCRRGPAASCSTPRSCRPRTSTARSPTWCAGSTRTPPTRTSCATCSAWSQARRPGALERDRFLAAFRPRRRPVRRAAPHAGPRAETATRAGRPATAAGSLRERARHRLVAARQPGLDRRRHRPLARSGAGADPARRSAATFVRRRRRARRPRTPRAPGSIAYRHALADRAAGRPGARRRPRRPAGLGGPLGCAERRALLDACADVLAGGAAT